MGRNLFANIDDAAYAAIEAVQVLSGLSKKALVEAMIAEKMGVTDNPNRSRVSKAWAKYRATRAQS